MGWISLDDSFFVFLFTFQQLYLAGNQITSLSGLPQLPNLEVFTSQYSRSSWQSVFVFLFGNGIWWVCSSSYPLLRID
jgi:hypothetical protein